MLGRIVARQYLEGLAGLLSGGCLLIREGCLLQSRELGRVWLEVDALVERPVLLLILAELLYVGQVCLLL